ncbi:hypothetical protein Pst134EB_001903 [Puccinia striiformis f. sp. tritici]|nr:hypothetical protein Pst134EB_001903 [Puccinia striiformis f. sp. tritici]
MSFEFSQNSDDVTLTDNHGAMSTGDGENPDKDDNLSAQIKSLVAGIGAMASTAEGVDTALRKPLVFKCKKIVGTKENKNNE